MPNLFEHFRRREMSVGCDDCRFIGIKASATFPGVPFKKIAITAINPVHPLDYPATPCGACRQVLSEYEHKYGKPIEVILSGQKGEIWKIDSIESLLPLSFGAEALPE